MNTRANAAGRSTKAVQNVAVTNSPEYEGPTEGANGVSAKVIDWPDTDRAPTIVEIDGVRFTRGSEQVTVIGRIEPGGHNGGQVVAAEIDGTILVRWRPGRNELPTGGSVLVLEASDRQRRRHAGATLGERTHITAAGHQLRHRFQRAEHVDVGHATLSAL
jgi:hypothetical protein